MEMSELSLKEKERCKELELKYQAEFLTGGYPKMMLLFHERMNKANQHVEILANRCDRLAEELKDLKEEREDMRKEIRGLMKANQELAGKNRAYAEKHFEGLVAGPIITRLQGSGRMGGIEINTQRKIECISITFGDEETGNE